ncbi:hypothetical protein DSAG12_00179 [Promethearchaeum syntrophicum]|uniref:Uncharacterized protein n=1 Tax=Promethearchaeum syntrophicum TaxID=2594042 RepID=A0A5B9D5W2_9ARCH|nr:hypothetical protein [Candidatus Prometheoarchaeum syntrophicum]QEE14366.1 hypothetical protein DSAG12_00179 [Candidatus Prometheoarchaeum syntrophicum]
MRNEAKKKGNKFLFHFILILIIFQSSILPLNLFIINIDRRKILSRSIQTPSSSSVNNLEIIQMNYSVDYEIVKNGKKTENTIPIMLYINGTENLYENGTISYYIGKNVTDETVLQLLANVFIEEQMNFFQNHQINEPFQTFFSYRREAMANNLSNFLTEASYTLFWLNTSGNNAGYLKQYRNIQFLNVVDPFLLGIYDENRIISEETWSDKKSDISKNVRILNSFYLRANYNNEQIINLHYDKTWTVLLRGKFENYDSDEDKYILDIKLVDSNLNLNYLPDNPYWDVRLRNFLIIAPLSSVGSIIVVFKIIKKSRIQKKEDILDKI